MVIDLSATDLAQILYCVETVRDTLYEGTTTEAGAKRLHNLSKLLDKLRVHERNMP